VGLRESSFDIPLPVASLSQAGSHDHYPLSSRKESCKQQRELKSYVTLAISIAGVAVSLGINLFLGVLMLFTVLKLLKLSLKEALIVAFTAEFGFLLGMVVIMFILITAGTMFGIKELEFNMTWEEIFWLAMSP